jgi:hypothetical protein
LPVVVGIGDEGEPFTEIAEPPDCLEQLEWELTRWPEGLNCRPIEQQFCEGARQDLGR